MFFGRRKDISENGETFELSGSRFFKISHRNAKKWKKRRKDVEFI